jgi:PIN domain nuclease of toxin-antitoxin system
LPSDVERPSENSSVLDSSAYLALILGEPGDDFVRAALRRGAAICSVNLAEVIGRLLDVNHTAQQVEDRLLEFAVPVVQFGAREGRAAGYLRASTRHLGLSLGDRACLALAAELGVPAITADRAWKDLDVGVEVVLCR